MKYFYPGLVLATVLALFYLRAKAAEDCNYDLDPRDSCKLPDTYRCPGGNWGGDCTLPPWENGKDYLGNTINATKAGTQKSTGTESIDCWDTVECFVAGINDQRCFVHNGTNECTQATNQTCIVYTFSVSNTTPLSSAKVAACSSG